MDFMDYTVHWDVVTNVQDVTTSTVLVIGDVNRAGRETTVKNVTYFHTTIQYFGPNETFINQWVLNAFIGCIHSYFNLGTMYLLLISACQKGFYGPNCTLACDDKCAGCNNVNGSCDRGCKPGWKGNNCQQRNVLQLCYNSISTRNEMTVSSKLIVYNLWRVIKTCWI